MLTSPRRSRWDAWARLLQKIHSRVPFLSCMGNHEIEPQYTTSAASDLYLYKTFTAANARYPMPQVPLLLLLLLPLLWLRGGGEGDVAGRGLGAPAWGTQPSATPSPAPQQQDITKIQTGNMVGSDYIDPSVQTMR